MRNSLDAHVAQANLYTRCPDMYTGFKEHLVRQIDVRSQDGNIGRRADMVNRNARRREDMNITRRRFVAGTLATVPLAYGGSRAFAQAGTALKISHQFPAASGPEGDFRD